MAERVRSDGMRFEGLYEKEWGWLLIELDKSGRARDMSLRAVRSAE